MPRIYTSANVPLDFCRKHYPNKEYAERRFADMGRGSDGENRFEYGADHPAYGLGDYACHLCGKRLVNGD